jgi:SAM-dependent methyltransferase
MKKMILGGSNLFSHEDNKMASEGDIVDARLRFIKNRFNNLDYLLKHRYNWMNFYLKENTQILEVGSGAGLSEFYLKFKPIMTDTTQNQWVDKIIDATDMNIPDNSVDVLIASHNIHHFSSPYKFFNECSRVLKPGGLILIQEVNTSLIMRIILFLMKHEGWSYDVDVFNKNTVVNDPSDPWSANCATPELLFEDNHKFQKTFKGLNILKNEKNEGFIFPLSGGVIAKTKVPRIPTRILDLVAFFDRILIKLFPNIFAMGLSVVIKKTV